MKPLFIDERAVITEFIVMTKDIKTEIVIKADPEKIWDILTCFQEYPQWNPFIRRIEGEVGQTNKIHVHLQPPKGSKMKFNPVVLSRIEHKELVWKGKLLFKGLFDGTHRFELIDNGDGTTTFIHSESFKGILVGLIDLNKTKNGFVEMNEKLKELAER